MKRTFVLLFLFVTLPLWADGPGRPVVVDPLDLRKPVPDPEGALTEKYDGKLVRFTGVVRRATLDKKTRQPRYELHHAILGPAKAGRKAEVVETIVVAVTLAEHENALPAPSAAWSQTVTVEGKGSVMADGSLVITEASVVLQKAPSAARR